VSIFKATANFWKNDILVFPDASGTWASLFGGYRKSFGGKMDKESKLRFEQLEKRYDDMRANLDRSINVFTWVLSTVLAILTVVYGLRSVIDSQSLENWKRETQESLGVVPAVPELELLGVNKVKLSGQKMKVEMIHDAPAPYRDMMDVHFILHNAGTGSSGPIFVKFYTSDPLVPAFPYKLSTDEAQFRYESVMGPKDLASDPSELPGNFSYGYDIWVPMSSKIIPSGHYPGMIKVFYGVGKFVQESFEYDVP
jgi:hypothetical protein